MKRVVWSVLLISVWAWSGFFDAAVSDDAYKEALENERLCKLFTRKAEEYKKHMRDDMLAKATLASYEHRAELFCSKVKKEQNETNASY